MSDGVRYQAHMQAQSLLPANHNLPLTLSGYLYHLQLTRMKLHLNTAYHCIKCSMQNANNVNVSLCNLQKKGKKNTPKITKPMIFIDNKIRHSLCNI